MATPLSNARKSTAISGVDAIANHESNQLRHNCETLEPAMRLFALNELFAIAREERGLDLKICGEFKGIVFAHRLRPDCTRLPSLSLSMNTARH